ncbi:MAG: peptidylprolyl isomerase [Isosphaeraceae bacterium]
MRNRGWMGRGLWLAAISLGCLAPAQAQGLFGGLNKPKKDAAVKPASGEKDGDKEGTIKLVPKEVPVSPNDPVAVVNGQVITRQQLADETVAREGKKVLEAMIAGTVIDQAVARAKIQIKPQEVEEEVEFIARGMGATKENWLRTLDKERGISPIQYKRDIVYRVVALRKLAEPRVQVTDEDMRKAYEANYGPKLHYRIILTGSMKDAGAIRNELQQNPAAFEKMARDDRRSIDSETKPLGGMGLQPMSRHAYPLKLSQSAFEQLVDGDPNDKNPEHKPKDGDLTGPIEVTENVWAIMRRESVEPAREYDAKDEKKRAEFRQLLQEVRLKEKMQEVYNELVEQSAVENRLTGDIKMANEGQAAAHKTDGNVKLMSNPPPPKVDGSQVEMTPGGPKAKAPTGVGPLNLPKSPLAPARPSVGQDAPRVPN